MANRHSRKRCCRRNWGKTSVWSESAIRHWLRTLPQKPSYPPLMMVKVRCCNSDPEMKRRCARFVELGFEDDTPDTRRCRKLAWE